MSKRKSIVRYDAHGAELHRSPGRPRTRAPKAPNPMARGATVELIERTAETLTAIVAGNPPSHTALNDLAGLWRSLIDRAKVTRAARQAALLASPNRGRPRSRLRVTRTVDDTEKVWEFDSVFQAAECVGLSSNTLQQYLSTGIGGPLGQWHRERAGLSWHVVRIKSGTEHASSTKAKQTPNVSPKKVN